MEYPDEEFVLRLDLVGDKFRQVMELYERRKTNNMRLPWINEKFVQKRAAKVTEADLRKAVNESEAIRKKFEHPGPLGRYIEDVKLLISIVKDYGSGEYRQIPWWAISAIVFTLLYVVSPVDLIPDFIPVIGYLDDAAVVTVCLMLVEQELHAYKQWKMNCTI